MEIERINDNTIKFYMSYLDIENRGFDREEIWYSRERSEQLFWQVMDEAGDQEAFDMDGPLWIQVQAMEKGLEITVTKAQLSKEEQDYQVPNEPSQIDEGLNERLDDLLDMQLGEKIRKASREKQDNQARLIQHTVAFKDFEDVIQLSHQINLVDGISSELYHYHERYVLIVKFDDDVIDDHVQDNLLSIIYEYGNKEKDTIPVILEYGKVIFAENALGQTQHYFK